MATFTFLHTRKPRGFLFKPRYYDERKERLAAMVSMAQTSQGDPSSNTALLTQARMQLLYREARAKRGRPRGRTVTRFLILALLLTLAMYAYMQL